VFLFNFKEKAPLFFVDEKTLLKYFFGISLDIYSQGKIPKKISDFL